MPKSQVKWRNQDLNLSLSCSMGFSRKEYWSGLPFPSPGGLACCDSWGRKESDTTERLIWSDLTDLSCSRVIFQLFYTNYCPLCQPFPSCAVEPIAKIETLLLLHLLVLSETQLSLDDNASPVCLSYRSW